MGVDDPLPGRPRPQVAGREAEKRGVLVKNLYWLTWIGLGMVALFIVLFVLLLALFGGEHPKIRSSFETRGSLLLAICFLGIGGVVLSLVGVWLAEKRHP